MSFHKFTDDTHYDPYNPPFRPKANKGDANVSHSEATNQGFKGLKLASKTLGWVSELAQNAKAKLESLEKTLSSLAETQQRLSVLESKLSNNPESRQAAPEGCKNYVDVSNLQQRIDEALAKFPGVKVTDDGKPLKPIKLGFLQGKESNTEETEETGEKVKLGYLDSL